MRRHIERRLEVPSPDNVAVLEPPSDIYRVPDVLALDACSPREMAKMPRHRATGFVLATWNGNRVLVQTPDGRLMRLDLADPSLPPFRSFIEAVGFPETDLYHINLTRACWRPAAGGRAFSEQVRPSSIRELTEEKSGIHVFEKRFYGKTLRIKGRITDPPHRGIMMIADENRPLPVDVSALGTSVLKGLAAGATVEVTGSCIMDVDNWRPHVPFPKIRSITLVTRTADDVRILAHPPWWTIGRLLAVIVGLIAALLGIFIWNRILQRMVERRGRELFREQVARVSADLRTKERTRLAIELHDSISQNLTAISLEIKTALTSARDNLPSALAHVGIAERSLASCHAELRNCLWDLRHGTLESLDMNEAIRQVLRPQVGNVGLSVRFNVPRSRLTDNTAYAVFKIIRELAVNAVHHGKATALKVAGALDGRCLRFSVTDNGTGFDPASAPGPEQGHFGLLGVTERVNGFEGEISIDSRRGQGTHVAVTLKAPGR